MALCVTRRLEQSIVLRMPDGTSCKIVVQGIGPGRVVRLAIEAPKTVEVIREELLYRDEAGWRARDAKVIR
jgi:sRNA-binding carbon storage regulator CsrA